LDALNSRLDVTENRIIEPKEDIRKYQNKMMGIKKE
jgi:hypothetical protein